MAREAMELNGTELLQVKMGCNNRWQEPRQGGFTGYPKNPKQSARVLKRTSRKKGESHTQRHKKNKVIVSFPSSDGELFSCDNEQKGVVAKKDGERLPRDYK